jgi:hypothetical protein
MFLGRDTIYQDFLLSDSIFQHCQGKQGLLSIPQGKPKQNTKKGGLAEKLYKVHPRISKNE